MNSPKMKCLAAVAKRYNRDWSSAVILAHWASDADKDGLTAWDIEFDSVVTRNPDDLGMLCPASRDPGLYVWEGTIVYHTYSGILMPNGEYDDSGPSFHGKWRPATPEEIQSFQSGTLFQDPQWRS